MDSIDELRELYVLPYLRIFRGSGSGEYYPRNWASALLLALFVGLCAGYYVLSSYPSKNGDGDDFKNEFGQRIKEIKRNTRATRILSGRHLSQEGKDLAGDEPYMINNGPFPELVLFAPDHLQEFLRKDAKDHYKPENMNMGDFAGQLLGQCVGQQNGQKWRTIRGYFDPEFSHQASLGMIPRFSEQINQWADDLPRNAIRGQSMADESFVRGPEETCKLLAFRLIAMSIYGEAFDEVGFLKLVELSKLHTKILAMGILLPWTASRWYNQLPTLERYMMNKFLGGWKKFNEGLIRSARERKVFCPAEVIFKGVDQHGQMSEKEFLQTVDEMLFFNIDITGSIVAFILVNLASNKPFQEKLRLEIAEQKSQASYNVTEYIGRQDTLLHYVTLESIRVTPAMYFSPPECTAAPKVIHGYKIPANTPIVIDVRRLNTNLDIWGPDANEFNPERFMGRSPSSYRFGLVRWGIASGKCMGKNIADPLLKLITRAVVERYVLSPVKGLVRGKRSHTVAVNDKIRFKKV